MKINIGDSAALYFVDKTYTLSLAPRYHYNLKTAKNTLARYGVEISDSLEEISLVPEIFFAFENISIVKGRDRGDQSICTISLYDSSGKRIYRDNFALVLADFNNVEFYLSITSSRK